MKNNIGLIILAFALAVCTHALIRFGITIQVETPQFHRVVFDNNIKLVQFGEQERAEK